MDQKANTNKSENAPYFFLTDEQYVLGTPKSIANLGDSIDVHFKDFAKNYPLQHKLNLASQAFIRPRYNHPLVTDSVNEQELLQQTAHFYAAFSNDPKEIKLKNDYLLDNGVIRILFLDNKLHEECKKYVTPS
jgi:hypothetical protein